MNQNFNDPRYYNNPNNQNNPYPQQMPPQNDPWGPKRLPGFFESYPVFAVILGIAAMGLFIYVLFHVGPDLGDHISRSINRALRRLFTGSLNQDLAVSCTVIAFIIWIVVRIKKL